MFIVPMNSKIDVNVIKSIGNEPGINAGKADENIGSGSFKEMFQGIIDNVEKTEAATRMDAYNLSIGNMDDLHTIMINAGKAEMALSTMVQLRNKVLDAYSEVMRTNL